jgi:hypothetical protein
MIQMPKLTHLTLPSVSDWSTDCNIIRDPPRSITTHRKDRIGDTSYITEVVDGSVDRANEYITVYSRGVNPMVSVSYDNNGNNAGANGNNGGMTNGKNLIAQNQQTKLPYRIMLDGAFIPPVRTEYDLLPLSRLPRVWFGALSQPGFTDYSKSKFCPTKFRMIKDIINSVEVKANKTAKIERAIVENYKMTNSINDKHINVGADSGTRSMDIKSYTRENVDKYKGVNETILEAWADTNKSKNISQNLEGMDIDKNRYIQEFLQTEGSTNISKHYTQGLENVDMDTSGHIQNIAQFEKNAGYNPGYTIIGEMADIVQERNFPVYNINSAVSDPRINKTMLHENELVYERNLPVQKNVSSNIRKIENFNSINLSSRNYKLPPTINKGSFENQGVKPLSQRSEGVFTQSLENGKTNVKENKAKIRSEVNSLHNRDYRPRPIQNQTYVPERPLTEKDKRKAVMNDLIFNRH